MDCIVITPDVFVDHVTSCSDIMRLTILAFQCEKLQQILDGLPWNLEWPSTWRKTVFIAYKLQLLCIIYMSFIYSMSLYFLFFSLLLLFDPICRYISAFIYSFIYFSLYFLFYLFMPSFIPLYISTFIFLSMYRFIQIYSFFLWHSCDSIAVQQTHMESYKSGTLFPHWNTWRTRDSIEYEALAAECGKQSTF